MSRRPWHKRFHGDAIAGYMGLSLEERGAYATLKDHIYDRGGPLPDNMRLLAGLLDISVRKAKVVVDNLVLKGKLYRSPDGKISNRRCDIELEKATSQADHMAEIGLSGGNKSAEKRKLLNETNDNKNAALDIRSSYLEPDSEPESKNKKVPLAKANGHGVVPLFPEIPAPKKPKSTADEARTELYRRGKELLGQSAGGVITNLLKLYDGKVHKARAKLEDAAEMREPERWLNAFLWSSPEGWGKNIDVGPM